MKVTGAIAILLLFVIRFDPCHIYALLYCPPAYGNSPICSYLSYWITSFVWLLIFVHFFRALVLSRVLYKCVVYDYDFHFDYFFILVVVYVSYYLPSLQCKRYLKSYGIQTPIDQAWLVMWCGTYYILKNT